MTTPAYEVGFNPTGWQFIPFFEVLDFKGGNQPPKQDFIDLPRPGYVRLLQIRDFASDEKAVYIQASKKWQTCSEEDILIGRYGASVGRVLRGKSGAYNVALIKVIIKDSRINREFLYYWLHDIAFQNTLLSVSRSAQNGFNKEDLKGLAVPVPPLAEQRRIVARIEALFARTRRARADLERIAPLSTRYYVRSLMAELEGQRDGAAHDTNRNPQPRTDPDLAGHWPFESIPNSWRWMMFGDAFEDQTSSDKKLPRRQYLDAGSFPVIDQGASVHDGWSNNEKLVHQGPLPAIIFGDHTRRVKLVTQRFIQGADGVKVLITKRDCLDPRYAFRMLQVLPLPDKGYARHAKFLRASYVPVPPLHLQQKISSKAAAKEAVAQSLEIAAVRALSLLDRLEQSILARAFRGELVPQDPAEAAAAVP